MGRLRRDGKAIFTSARTLSRAILGEADNTESWMAAFAAALSSSLIGSTPDWPAVAKSLRSVSPVHWPTGVDVAKEILRVALGLSFGGDARGAVEGVICDFMKSPAGFSATKGGEVLRNFKQLVTGLLKPLFSHLVASEVEQVRLRKCISRLNHRV